MALSPEIILKTTPIPRKRPRAIAPVITDEPTLAFLVKDERTGKVLLSERADAVQPIASLTKLMTVLVILEDFKMPLDKKVTIPESAAKISGAGADLLALEELYARDLIAAALIPSANDAAHALAVTAAGSEAQFVEKMNEKAKKMGLTTLFFYNSTGLPFEDANGDEKHNLGSPEDVLRLAEAAMSHSIVRTLVKQPNFEATSVDETFFHEKKNTNQLLGSFLNVLGVKTGYTDAAGQCLVIYSQKTTVKGTHGVYSVVLGSGDRFGTTKKLVSWVWDNVFW